MRCVVPETFIDREYAYSGRDEPLKSGTAGRVTDYFYDTGRGASRRAGNEAYLDSWQCRRGRAKPPDRR